MISMDGYEDTAGGRCAREEEDGAREREREKRDDVWIVKGVTVFPIRGLVRMGEQCKSLSHNIVD